MSAHRFSADHSQSTAADSTPPVLPAHTREPWRSIPQDAGQSAIPSSHAWAHGSHQPVIPTPSVPHAAHRLPQLPPHVCIQAFCCHKEKEGSESRKDAFSTVLFGNAESELISIEQLVQTRYAKPTHKFLEDLSSLLSSLPALRWAGAGSKAGV